MGRETNTVTTVVGIHLKIGLSGMPMKIWNGSRIQVRGPSRRYECGSYLYGPGGLILENRCVFLSRRKGKEGHNLDLGKFILSGMESMMLSERTCSQEGKEATGLCSVMEVKGGRCSRGRPLCLSQSLLESWHRQKEV